jgi:putative oxidoreductase
MRTQDVGTLALRLGVGGALAAHGAQKLFGWWGGFGLAKTTGFMSAVGYRPPRLFALAVSGGEIVSGLLTALGLLGPAGPALMILIMLVAIGVAHWGHGFFAAGNGLELPLLYIAGALVLALAGPGSYSLDGLLGLQSLSTPSLDWAAVGLAVVGAAVNLGLRRPAPQEVAA